MREAREIDQDNGILVLLSLSRGAKSRKNILKILHLTPRNCNQIAKESKLDWWTVQKHLQLLIKVKLVKSMDFGHTKFYKLTQKGEEVLKKVQ